MSRKIVCQRETLITLAEVPNHLPKRNGKKVHYSTIYRWVTKGARGRVLESMLVGGVRYTTVEAIERFLNSSPGCATSDEVAAIHRTLDEAGL